MTTKDGGAAFPALNFIVPNDLEKRHVACLGETRGMSLRDYFAAQVMGSMLIEAESYTHAAALSYEYADAMIAELNK